ncbi:hypothetical protein [Flagellimonas sp. S3867]|uniref:hypothetical protein n=1 Tax=Flagellimonas sp. S3867 TaxID=2768063 RepID=UPI001687BA92|nr:hypothetical protein [Flagellimonas sp. S3867]
MRNLLSLGLIILLLSSCASTQLVSNWKNPDYVIFDASKVLIVGMTQNEDARIDFETKLRREFRKRDVEAMRSVDLFDVSFTNSAKSEEELDDVEQQLLDKDFDAILFTKVIGSEDFTKFRKRMSEIDGLYGKFRDDYLEYQPIYYETDYYDKYTVYHAETSLYCICVDKERELIWRGAIDITDPINIEKTVEEYIKLIVFALEEQDIIFRKETKDEDHESIGL